MPILYSVVARGTTVLVKHAVCPGNFAEVTEQILQKISPEDAKLTYSHAKYLFHYVSENQIIYMAITDDEFERSKAFAYLADIKRRFQTTYGARAQTALPYAMNSDFSIVLASEMKAYSQGQVPVSRTEPRTSYGTAESGKLGEAQGQVEDLKQIMVRNIDSLADRGEKLELLIDRTENLEANAVSFRTRSRNLANAMCWKNVKITAILIVVGVVLIFTIVTISCGGFSYPKCSPKTK